MLLRAFLAGLIAPHSRHIAVGHGHRHRALTHRHRDREGNDEREQHVRDGFRHGTKGNPGRGSFQANAGERTRDRVEELHLREW